MAYEQLMDAVQGLPEDKIYDVIAFIDFLKARLQGVANTEESNTTPRTHKERILGQMKGKIRMAEDFDAIPDDFKEYM